MPETALVILVPEAEPLVADWRAKYAWSAERGVPAHITLLYPFVPTERLDNDLRDELRRMFAAQAAFSFRLTRVARFPDVAWLAPEPAEPFGALTELIAARYPDYPPYQGVHDEVIPHLTVAEGGVDLQDGVDAALTPHLPIEVEVGSVELLVEDDNERWHGADRFPLSGRSAS
jgi:2'-5' RNA ligase